MPLPTSTEEIVTSVESHDDLVAWINDILPAESDSTDHLAALDQLITSLLSTLEVACEDTSTQLERIIDTTSRAVPRLVYDVNTMRDGALSLQSRLNTVQQQCKSSVSDETAATLQELRSLDLIKRNMEATREVLREAENWSSLEFEVTSFLADSSYSKAAERLSEASKSMAVFQNTPEYESRRALMVNLQNQLEASLSSALVSAISAHELATCKEFYAIFSNIQREAEFRNYYNGSRRTSIASLWREADLAESEGSSSHQLLSSFLPHFYADFLSLLELERLSIPQIFPDPSSTLSQFISSTITNLQPTFPQRLASLLTHHGPAGLKELEACLKATEAFASKVERLFEKIQFSLYAPPTPFESSHSSDSGGPPTTPSHSRRRSVRMSMSWRPGGHRSTSGGINVIKPTQDIAAEDLDWDQELFQPFLAFLVDYGTLERRLSERAFEELASKDSSSQRSPLDRPRMLRERVVDVVGIAEGCLARCASFTYGYGSVGLLQALDKLFSSFMDTWSADLEMKPSPSITSPLPTPSTGQELSDLDYSARDWHEFQLSVHFIASARAVLDRISHFEQKLRGFLLDTSNQFRTVRQDSTRTITSSRRLDQLLEQSVLNSVELQTLFSSVDPESRDGTTLPPTLGRSTNTGPPTPLLPGAQDGVFSFARACQTLVQKTLLSPLRKHLAGYSSLPVWSATDDLKKRGPSSGAYDLQVPTFSLSPTETVQRVAEGLLNLPRLFEVYAEDDALSFSLHTLPFLNADLLSSLALSPEESSGQRPAHGHLRKRSFASKAPVMSSIDPETVSSAWLASLSHCLLDHLTSDVLPAIPSLSTHGAAQLSSDLGYLSNIVSAVSMNYDGLDKWKEAVAMTDEEGKVAVRSKENGDNAALLSVARMRGWKQ